MKRKYPISFYIIGISVVFYLLQQFSVMLFGYDYLLLFGAKINEFIIKGEVWRLITPAAAARFDPAYRFQYVRALHCRPRVGTPLWRQVLHHPVPDRRVVGKHGFVPVFRQSLPGRVNRHLRPDRRTGCFISTKTGFCWARPPNRC